MRKQGISITWKNARNARSRRWTCSVAMAEGGQHSRPTHFHRWPKPLSFDFFTVPEQWKIFLHFSWTPFSIFFLFHLWQNRRKRSKKTEGPGHGWAPPPNLAQQTDDPPRRSGFSSLRDARPINETLLEKWTTTTTRQ